jgi:viologen exporter family transport system permease protein
MRTLRFVLAYLRLNLSAAVEYRGAFLAQAVGMMLNDLVFIIFWGMYFARFPNVGGWGVQDVALLWAVAATSIGLSAALLGNCTRIATIVVQGQLDYYLGLPKDTLLHVLISRSGLAGWGDVCFGLLAYAFFGRFDLATIGLYVVLVLASMLIFVAFGVLAGSLGFWMGNAEATAFQAQQATINFSLYPGSVFQGWIRVLIFTLVPAGFISHLPVELLRTFDPWRLAAVLGFAALSVLLALLVFRLGLRRYESGNLVILRG